MVNIKNKFDEKEKKCGSYRTRGETIIERVCRTVPGFEKTCRYFKQQIVIRQRSKSAINNYGRSIAKIAL